MGSNDDNYLDRNQGQINEQLATGVAQLTKRLTGDQITNPGDIGALGQIDLNTKHRMSYTDDGITIKVKTLWRIRKHLAASIAIFITAAIAAIGKAAGWWLINNPTQ